MTKPQEKLYWREWAAVRAAWPEADRHELHIRALGKDTSHKAFSNVEFDKVLAEFRSVSRPNDVASQLRQLRQARTRLLWKITTEQVSLLSVLLAGETEFDRRAAAERYVLNIIRDRFHAEDINDLSDHSPGDGIKSDLEMLRDTLDARINELRRSSGQCLTIHMMKQLAGVKCDCRACCRSRREAQQEAA